jgi:hypothetical protein
MIEDKIDKLIAAIETLTETLSKGVKAEDTKKEKSPPARGRGLKPATPA